MSLPETEKVRGLLTGLRLEASRLLDTPPAEGVCRHVAWYVGVGGFGLSYEEVGRAENVSKQAVGDAILRINDRCDDRKFERRIEELAQIFKVSL